MSGLSVSRYSKLQPVRDETKAMFHGRWNGKRVAFDRKFRGYVFSDEECVALCDGEMLAVHGLERNGVRYSVAGFLKESPYQNRNDDVLTVMFKQDHTIAYDPEYDFASRIVHMAGEPEEIRPSKPARAESYFDPGFDAGMSLAESEMLGEATADLIENPIKFIMQYDELLIIDRTADDFGYMDGIVAGKASPDRDLPPMDGDPDMDAQPDDFMIRPVNAPPPESYAAVRIGVFGSDVPKSGKGGSVPHEDKSGGIRFDRPTRLDCAGDDLDDDGSLF